MFSNATSLKKIENLQKRASRFLYNNYQLAYEELLESRSVSLQLLKPQISHLFQARSSLKFRQL